MAGDSFQKVSSNPRYTPSSCCEVTETSRSEY